MLLQIPSIDWTAVLTTTIPTILNLGLISWVYKVMKAMNDDSKGQIKTLKEDVEKLKKSENKWFKRYHILARIIASKKCKDECQIHQAYVDWVAKEGETI